MRRVGWLAALLVAGCGGPTAPSAPSPPRAAVSIMLEGVSVTPSSDPAHPWLGRWTVVVSETGRAVGGRVSAVNATLRDAASGARGAGSSLTGEQVAAAAGTNLVPAGGSLRVPESLAYALPSGGRRANLSVAVQFQDDTGHSLTVSAEAVTP